MTNVTIDNVVVSNSIGMGVAMYDVTRNVTVSNSIFRNNSVPSHKLTLYPGGGGFSVEFTYCKLGGNISSTCCKTNEGASYLYHHCTFDHNNASTNIPLTPVKLLVSLINSLIVVEDYQFSSKAILYKM